MSQALYYLTLGLGPRLWCYEASIDAARDRRAADHDERLAVPLAVGLPRHPRGARRHGKVACGRLPPCSGDPLLAFIAQRAFRFGFFGSSRPTGSIGTCKSAGREPGNGARFAARGYGAQKTKPEDPSCNEPPESRMKKAPGTKVASQRAATERMGSVRKRFKGINGVTVLRGVLA